MKRSEGISCIFNLDPLVSAQFLLKVLPMFLLVLISHVLSSCINSRINSSYIVKLPVCKVCQWQRSTGRHRPKREELTYKQQGDLTSGPFYHTFTMSTNPSGYEPPRNLPLPPRRLKHAKSANPILSSKSFYSAHRDHPHAPLQQQSPMLYTPDLGEWAIASHGMYESTLVFISVLK